MQPCPGRFRLAQLLLEKQTIMNTTSTFVQNSLADSPRNPVFSLIDHLVRTNTAIAPAVLRVTLAAVMFPHGAQKLLGWYGGYGFSGTMGFFTGDMGVPWLLALGTILIEFFAPLLLVLGLGTRLAALCLGVVMTTAMFMAHVSNGFFMNWSGAQKGEGIEYFLLIIGIALAQVISGGGRWSADGAIRKALS